MIVLKNIIRAPKRNIILFLIAFVLAVVMMAVLFIKDYAEDGISESMGPLSNTLKVTVADGKPALKCNTAMEIRDGFGVITEMHAVSSGEFAIDGVDTSAAIFVFHADDDVEFARTLVNHNDVDTCLGNGFEQACGRTDVSDHTVAHCGNQRDIFVRVNFIRVYGLAHFFDNFSQNAVL